MLESFLLLYININAKNYAILHKLLYFSNKNSGNFRYNHYPYIYAVQNHLI